MHKMHMPQVELTEAIHLYTLDLDPQFFGNTFMHINRDSMWEEKHATTSC